VSTGAGEPVQPRVTDGGGRPGYVALAADRLLPEPCGHTAAELGLVSDGPIDLADRCRGSLLGGAIGDALGRPGEVRPRSWVREEYGLLLDFVPWSGHVDGPTGTITDDTQLTMVVAECLRDNAGRIDPDDLARRLVAWLPDARGAGRATTKACRALAAGAPWWSAGTPSAGNGAAMRVAPVGLVHRTAPDTLRTEAAISAVPTHRDPVAVGGAVVHAFAVSWCTHRVGPVDPDALVGAIGRCLVGVHDPGSVPRQPDRTEPEWLAGRVAEIPGMLHLDADDAFDHFHNGAFVLESLPSALWCFLRHADDPETALVVAASGGRDSDTVAAMVGGYVGALHGVAALPERWRADLEYHDELVALADRLTDLASAD